MSTKLWTLVGVLGFPVQSVDVGSETMSSIMSLKQPRVWDCDVTLKIGWVITAGLTAVEIVHYRDLAKKGAINN